MEDKRGNLISIHFDSILDLDIQKYLNTNHINKNKFNYIYNMKNRDIEWLGPTINKFQDAYDHALIGDHELYEKNLLPKINELDRLIYDKNDLDNINTVPVVKRKRKRSDFGDELDIQYVLRGQLDKAWQTTERIQKDQEHRLITLVIDIAGLMNINCLDTLWSAAACLKICDDLQKSGKSIQIIVAAISNDVTNKNSSMVVSYNIKRYNEHLSIERLAAMSHIGFFRTLGFLAKLTSAEKCRGDLGRSARFANSNLPFYLQDEIKAGKTKAVILHRSLNLHSAYNSINSAYKQIFENSKMNIAV